MFIRELTTHQLHEFIYSEEYRNMKVVPISKHRAISHINNPRVEKDDIIMLIAYIDNIMVGYLGVFADKIYLNEIEHKAGWLSCMWVDPAIRGKGIAKQLLNRALETWQQRILVTEFTEAAKGLYDKSGAFIDLQVKQGIRGYLRFNLHELLVKKKPQLERHQKLIGFADNVANLLNTPRLSMWNVMLRQDDSRVEYVNTIDQQLSDFIDQQLAGQLFRRNGEMLNWIIKYPWVLTGGSLDKDSLRYHFTSIISRAENICLKILDLDGNISGFMMLTIRGNNLKVPYCYIRNEDLPLAATIIYKHMLSMGLNMVTLFHPALSEYIFSSKSPFYKKRAFKRHYIISKVFKEDLDKTTQITIMDGDADCVFT